MLEARRLKISVGGCPLLSDVVLTLRAGERIALFGRSGSGKSTLLRVLAGLLNPDDGVLVCDGIAYGADNPATDSWQNRPLWPTISLVFQDYRLLPHLTARENCLLGYCRQAETAESLEELAHALGIHRCLNRRPSSLSHGERQRCAILRTIIRRPRYLLLDEPTSALDRTSQDALVRLLNDAPFHPEMACIAVTHDVGFAHLFASRFLNIHEERLSSFDRLPDLFGMG